MGNNRVWILLAIFVILIGALFYDFRVARPAVHDAYLVVMDMLEKRGAATFENDKIGPPQVQEKLGRKPSGISTKGLTTIETYEWRGGMPLRTYKLYVLYTGLQNPLLANVLENEAPTIGEISSFEIVTPNKAIPMSAEPGPISVGEAPGSGQSGTKKGGRGKKKASENSDESKSNESTSNDAETDAKPDSSKDESAKAKTEPETSNDSPTPKPDP